MGKAKRLKREGGRRERLSRDPWEQMLAGEIGPMNFEGRLITPEVIAEMRALNPEDAHQLDAEWERAVLENNRPWIEDPRFRQATEAMWTERRKSHPDAFTSCGCADH